MNNISRRNFIKLMAAAGGTVALRPVFAPSFLMAESRSTGNGVNIVSIFLDGGLDGLAAFPLYAGNSRNIIASELRPSIAVPVDQILTINSQNGISNKVGLHPAFSSLVNVAGSRMKIIQGYGIPGDPGRSHDTSQVLMSLGQTSISDTQMRGFYARLMDSQNWDTLQYWAFNSYNQTDTNTSKLPPLRLSELDSFNYISAGWQDSSQVSHSAQLTRNLLELQDPKQAVHNQYKNQYQLMHDTVALVRNDIATQVVGNNGAGDYEGYGIGSQLKDVARVLSAKVNRQVPYRGQDQVFLLRQDGYDTHSDQANPNNTDYSLAGRLEDLSNNLAVFYSDLIRLGVADKTYIILYSEFGRTLFQNSNQQSAGTDHGHASNTLVIGGSRVNAGIVGEAPEADELRDQWYNALKPHIDYRDIFAEVFHQTMGIAPEELFPEVGYTYQRQGIIS